MRIKKGYSRRIVKGYYCRLIYDDECECYLITCDKFPELLEDGSSSAEAVGRMDALIRRTIYMMKKKGKEIPPMDDPGWERAMRFAKQRNNEKNYDRQ